MGLPQLKIQLEAAVTSLFGVLLGPYLGGLTALIGVLIATFYGGFTPVSLVFLPCPVFNAVISGFIAWKGWKKKPLYYWGLRF
ncbi:MAG: ECF transporter S component [Candidatus Freyarchaeota archaeon]